MNVRIYIKPGRHLHNGYFLQQATEPRYFVHFIYCSFATKQMEKTTIII
ncbi:hypothetical protein B4096_1611 [Heyndrickxia coagulans]|nr:hypothetical protein B4100_1678 [Heyndrickxia coagulans]KYC82764.1 hypothetical protein B4096_1611 [Heyndrickxia coagulans]